MKVAADSGPLISLASIAFLDILRSLFQTIYIPEGVYQEGVVTGKGRAGSEEVAHAAWIHCHRIKNKRHFAKLMSEDGLDQGESEAIVLAREMKAIVAP